MAKCSVLKQKKASKRVVVIRESDQEMELKVLRIIIKEKLSSQHNIFKFKWTKSNIIGKDKQISRKITWKNVIKSFSQQPRDTEKSK